MSLASLQVSSKQQDPGKNMYGSMREETLGMDSRRQISSSRCVARQALALATVQLNTKSKQRIISPLSRSPSPHPPPRLSEDRHTRVT